MTYLNPENYLHAETQSWEIPLLQRANEAVRSLREMPIFEVGKHDLQAAYAHCEAITATNSRSFSLASGLLPTVKRKGVRALYAFCRVSDDIVDNCHSDGSPTARAERLARWKELVLGGHPSSQDMVALAWVETMRAYRIPPQYAVQLIDGVARDLQPVHCETFAQLAAYSYGVASTVGLMSMYIIGYSSKSAIQYAIRLGVALQLTNILRDVGEDLRRGRVYLPQDELQAYGISIDDLRHARITARWREFMQFQIQRNRNLYQSARPGIAYLRPEGRFSIAAAADLYEGILSEIEANDYDVFRKRAYLTKSQKLRRLPGIWWRNRQIARPE